jgi:hypothetical protein
MFEIGAGNSTCLSAQAILKNKQEDALYECQLLAIDPHPSDILTKGFPGLSDVVHRTAQEIPLAMFHELNANDVLFIDSSHVLKTGSDVQYLYLDVLPNLKRGVIIHAHDIFLPAEYPKEWVLREYRFWTEQYLLQAFLAFNHTFEILWAGSYMHQKHPDKLENAFASYKREERWPGSFWMRKVK